MRAVPKTCLALTCLALGTAASHADAATYTNLADFNAAVLAGGYQMDTVLPGGTVTFLSSGVGVDGVSFINPDFGKFTEELPVTFYSGPDLAGQGSLVGGLGLSPLEILLPPDTHAFGYEVKDEQVGGGYSFFGETSSTPLLSTTLIAQGGSSDYLLVRSATFGPAAAAVPESGTLPLLGLGLAGVLFAARRRKG